MDKFPTPGAVCQPLWDSEGTNSLYGGAGDDTLDVWNNSGTQAAGFYFTKGSAVFQFTTAASTAAVPEPATTGLIGPGLAGLLGMRRRVRA